MRVKALCLVLATAFCLAASTAAAQAVPSAGEPGSATLVKQLVTAMSAMKLEAIAAKDPTDPTRIIAALAFPGVQLLVMSSQHPSADYLNVQIGRKAFMGVYEALQHGVPESRLFFHDIGCDGFVPGDYVDIFYEGPNQRTMFNGNWEAQSLTAAAYAEKQKAAEAQYARALTVLLDAVKKMTTNP